MAQQAPITLLLSTEALLSPPNSEPSFEVLDWLVLAAYAVLMIGIGVY